MRDPRKDPRPGDVVGKKIRMKCVSILLSENGINQVSYSLAWPNREFGEHAVTNSLENWRRMAHEAEVLHVANES